MKKIRSLIVICLFGQFCMSSGYGPYEAAWEQYGYRVKAVREAQKWRNKTLFLSEELMAVRNELFLERAAGRRNAQSALKSQEQANKARFHADTLALIVDGDTARLNRAAEKNAELARVAEENKNGLCRVARDNYSRREALRKERKRRVDAENEVIKLKEELRWIREKKIGVRDGDKANSDNRGSRKKRPRLLKNKSSKNKK